MPSKESKQTLLRNARHLGVSELYPKLLPLIDGVPLEPGDYPNAADFCERLVTLPCHAAVTNRDISSLIAQLKRSIQE
jgi:dTDP-4-amino-4,6-dideoxygalactose transaminase